MKVKCLECGAGAESDPDTLVDLGWTVISVKINGKNGFASWCDKHFDAQEIALYVQKVKYK